MLPVKCVQQAWDSPKGYVIMSGCSLPVETPFINIEAMMEAAREIGYPIDPEKLSKLFERHPHRKENYSYYNAEK